MIKRLMVYMALWAACCSLWADPLEEAYKSYTLGEQAGSIKERELYFNQSLKLYSEHQGEDPKLYFNIANCYYQLDQMGMAIWYYHKAKALAPRDAKIDLNLKKAYQQAHIIPSSMEGVLSSLFFFHTKLLYSERAALFYALLILSFLFTSLFIWKGQSIFKILTLYLLAPICLFGLSLSMDYLNRYSKAILVQPSLLRCDAGKHYKEVGASLELAGQQVKVLKISPDQKWVKIRASKKEGYVLAEKIRVL